MCHICAAIEKTEVGIGQKTFGSSFILMRSNLVHVKLLAYENILFMQGISFTQQLQQGSEEIREFIIAGLGSRILSDRVLDFEDSRIITTFCINYSHTIYIFHTEINVFEDLGSLSSSAKGTNGYAHACQYGDKERYHCDCYHVVESIYFVIIPNSF